MLMSHALAVCPHPLLQCSGDFVSKQLAWFQSAPRFQSLINAVPCDTWSVLRSRTLWLVGDSQAQRFYRQLVCYLRPFHLPKEHSPDPAWLPEGWGQRMSSDAACQAEVADGLLHGPWECCGVEQPACTRLLGKGRVCHMRVNKGDHMLRVLRNLHLLGATRDDIVE